MLAFTFPGQGPSDLAWAAPGSITSWELVDEASEVAGRRRSAAPRRRHEPATPAMRSSPPSSRAGWCSTRSSASVSTPGSARVTRSASTPPSQTGALGFQEGVVLVSERAEAMHDAGNACPGTMAAVLGLDDQVEVAAISPTPTCGSQLQRPVRSSSPVRPGASSCWQARQGSRRQAGHAAPGPGAFHTAFMTPARDRLAPRFAAADIRDAEIPVASNVDAKPHDRGAEWASLLSAQLASPAVEALTADAAAWRH
ncbi:MAG: hypothetical protein R2697_17240 [Ilumatobacteraceae bacterium]